MANIKQFSQSDINEFYEKNGFFDFKYKYIKVIMFEELYLFLSNTNLDDFYYELNSYYYRDLRKLFSYFNIAHYEKIYCNKIKGYKSCFYHKSKLINKLLEVVKINNTLIYDIKKYMLLSICNNEKLVSHYFISYKNSACKDSQLKLIKIKYKIADHAEEIKNNNLFRKGLIGKSEALNYRILKVKNPIIDFSINFNHRPSENKILSFYSPISYNLESKNNNIIFNYYSSISDETNFRMKTFDNKLYVEFDYLCDMIYNDFKINLNIYFNRFCLVDDKIFYPDYGFLVKPISNKYYVLWEDVLFFYKYKN